MIEQSIILHEEPAKQTTTTYGSYFRPEIKESELQKILLEAKTKYKEGDKVPVKASGTVVVVCGFNETVNTMTFWKGEPCIVRAYSHVHGSPSKPVNYSLDELDWEKLEPHTDTESILVLLPGECEC